MPKYNTKCETCSTESEQKLTFSFFEKLKNGEVKLVCSCGGNSSIKFEPSTIDFSLKDGISGGWASKAFKENNYRAARNKEMDRRTREHVSPKNLVPNYMGTEASSWREAQAEAKSDTFQKAKAVVGESRAKVAAEEAGKSYDKYVKKETLSK